MKGARGLLINITGGNDLTLYEVDEAANRIREEVDPDANIIFGATFDDELDGSIRVSVVATGIGLPRRRRCSDSAGPGARSRTRSRLSERLAGLAAHAACRRPRPHPSEAARAVRPAAEEANEAPVWRAPGNVTIERRQPQMPSAPIPLGTAQPKPASAATGFVPAPPATAPRAVRRMPNVEEFPLPVQNEIRARSGRSAATLGLAAQKKKVGFLERLTGVGRRGRAARDGGA